MPCDTEEKQRNIRNKRKARKFGSYSSAFRLFRMFRCFSSPSSCYSHFRYRTLVPPDSGDIGTYIKFPRTSSR
jgi:hypothetical protein